MLPTSTSTTQLVPRQSWAWPTPRKSPAEDGGGCRNFTLREGATLVFNPTSTLTLPSDVVYQPKCSGPAFGGQSVLANDSVQQYHAPFYASVTPLVYVVAATTFVAWFLLIILFVVPGGYVSVSSRRQTTGWSGGRGILRLLTSRSSVIGFGTRPWLQKIAAILVVLALTTVSADTFKQARRQYVDGYINAVELRKAVTYSTEVRAIRVISDLFLWLAQIQTLIRLFPRHKEKLIIKWVGFLLICLDIIFSSLNSFTIADRYEPRRYQDAIPALSYLFQLALSLLYGTWVLYYAITKRRYAFYHPSMPNICLIALFSIIAVLVPVVFFLVDILQPDVGAWGDYFRWVAAAAASIMVWEWVERIEALERDEKKDGILGREIFDEDEIQDRSARSDTSSRTSTNGDDAEDNRPPYRKVGLRIGRIGASAGKKISHAWNRTFDYSDPPPLDEKRISPQRTKDTRRTEPNPTHDTVCGSEISAPDPVASPVDRTHATSAGSTIYAIHYHPVTQTPPVASAAPRDDVTMPVEQEPPQAAHELRKPTAKWRLAANTFKRSRMSPPLEVQKIMSLNSSTAAKAENSAEDGSQHRSGFIFGKKKRHSMENTNSITEPTIIPAPTRGHTPWSPDTMRHTPLTEVEASPSSNLPGQQEPIILAVDIPRFASTEPHDGANKAVQGTEQGHADLVREAAPSEHRRSPEEALRPAQGASTSAHQLPNLNV